MNTPRQTRKGRASWAPLLAIASAVLLYLAVAPTGVSMPRRGLALVDVNPGSATFGRSFDLRGIHAEQGVLLRFVASWCDVCRDELPAIQAMQAARAGSPPGQSSRVPIVLVAADEDGPPGSLLAQARAHGLTTPILYVPENRVRQVAARFDYDVLPATYLIDRSGEIRMAHEGALAVERLNDLNEMEAGLGS